VNYPEALFHVENKVTVLTGGGGILAGTMAKGFLQTNATVALLDINEAHLKTNVESLHTIGYDVTGFPCDVLNEATLKETHQNIADLFHQIDILINAAGEGRTDQGKKEFIPAIH